MRVPKVYEAVYNYDREDNDLTSMGLIIAVDTFSEEIVVKFVPAPKNNGRPEYVLAYDGNLLWDARGKNLQGRWHYVNIGGEVVSESVSLETYSFDELERESSLWTIGG